MKHQGLVITSVIFFLVINTTYFWEGKLDLFAFPVFVLLVVAYLVLAVCLIRQIYFVIREKFSDRQRLFGISLLAIVLVLTFCFPRGLIDCGQLSGKDLLIAQREGAANCMTTFKLKENSRFSEKSVCFGSTETKGTYEMKGDTIFFTTVHLGTGEEGYYKFAVIKRSTGKDKNGYTRLVRYKKDTDTIGHELLVTKNILAGTTS